MASLLNGVVPRGGGTNTCRCVCDGIGGTLFDECTEFGAGNGGVDLDTSVLGLTTCGVGEHSDSTNAVVAGPYVRGCAEYEACW